MVRVIKLLHPPGRAARGPPEGRLRGGGAALFLAPRRRPSARRSPLRWRSSIL